VILDDHSRFVLCCEGVASLASSTVAQLLVRTINTYGGRRPAKLLSDNHRAFRSRAFKGLLSRLGIKAVHSSVHHPQTLGKVERFNRTFQENAWLFPSPQAYLRYYNYEKRHSALGGGAPPATAYFAQETFKDSKSISSLGVTVTRLG
jgi:transposase InsO family protein